MQTELQRRKYGTLAVGTVVAILGLAGLAACDLGPSAPDPATVEPGIVDHPAVDAGPSGNPASQSEMLACGQPCALTPDICLVSNGGGCVVHCLDMSGVTGRPQDADCNDRGDPAGWCVDANNDHVCDASAGTATPNRCVDATPENLEAMRSGPRQTVCSRNATPPFGCPAGLACEDRVGAGHVCNASFCNLYPITPEGAVQPDIDQPLPPPPVDQPTETVTEVATEIPPEQQPTEAQVTCECERNQDGSGLDGDYICFNPDGSVASKERRLDLCPVPPTPEGGGGAKCGNGKVEKGEECETDSDCKGNKAGNSCFVPGCFCGPG